MVGARIKRKDPVVVGEVKASFLEPEMKIAAFEYSPVLVAENRKQHLVVQSLFQRIPVDVKKLRESRAGAVLQDIHPPFILWINDPHMVGDEINDLTHGALI